MVKNVIIHNLRSIHNVGAILRTCDGFGVSHVYIGGTSPYPRVPDDSRLPHIIDKQTSAIAKVALGAETSLRITHYNEVTLLLTELKSWTRLVGLEQDRCAIPLSTYHNSQPISLLIGEEVAGIETDLRQMCDDLIEIPMSGQKESFNVSVACGIALYALHTSQQ
jgi:tRNA G18 (ribose-2'-O)-methylase SpoU